MSLFNELKRRNVFRVGIAYTVAAWVLLQVVDLVLENIATPDWVMKVFMLGVILGFPIAIVIAWAFEVTPDGIKRESEIDRSQSIASNTGHKLDRIIMAFLVLAIVLLVSDRVIRKEAPPASPAPVKTVANQIENINPAQTKPVTASTTRVIPTTDLQSVAVLPFINMSDDEENEYFSDGISEELLNVLVQVKGLRVPSRTSSFTFKGSKKKLADIGRELGVDHVLEGSVRKSGDRIRVTAQLIEVNTDTHLWSETYTRKLDDIFAVQDEIAQAIVSALKITLSGNVQSLIQNRPTNNVDAYNKYLLGRHLWNQRLPASLLASVKPLQEAVTLDPGYGQAWAALADAYVLIPEYGAGSTAEYIPLAHTAAAKALAINPESARALTTSAYIKFMYDYDLEGAKAEFEKAISFEPGYATAHQWYGELLEVTGYQDAAMNEFRLARKADPLAAIMPYAICWSLSFTHRWQEAFSYCQEALILDPRFNPAIDGLAYLNLRAGKFDQARQRYRELASITDTDMTSQLAVVDALENPAMKEVALSIISQDAALPDGVLNKGFYLMLLNQPELAMDNLEKAFAAGDSYAVHLMRMDVYAPLHSNPRFQALLKKMNMSPGNTTNWKSDK